MHRRARAAVLAAAVLTTVSLSAWSSPTTDRSLAQSLFEAARELMAAGKYDEACPKFAESQRLDPAGGTLLNLAVCHDKQGRTATAWAEYKDALSQARQEGRKDRQELAARRIAELEPLLSRLTLELPASIERSGLQVELDGVAVGQAVLGTALPADPGEHVIRVSKSGYVPWETKIVLAAEADRKTVAIPELQPLPANATAETPAEPEPTIDAGVSTDDGSSQRTIGYVVGGAGLLATAAGAYFGLQAYSKWDERNAHCESGSCDGEAVEAKDDASLAANLSNVGFGLGLVGIGFGAYLVWTAGDDGPEKSSAAGATRIEPLVGRAGAGVSVGGTW